MKCKGLIITSDNQLQPLTNYVPISLVPLAMLPLISFQIKKLKQAGVTEIGVIGTSQDLHKIRNIVASGDIYGVKLTYIESTNDLLDSINAAQEFISGSPLLVTIGESIYEGKLTPKMGKCQVYTCDSSDAEHYVEYSAMGNLSKITKQVTDHPTVGTYFFTDGKLIVDKAGKASSFEEAVSLLIKDSNLAVIKLEGKCVHIKNMLDYHNAQQWAVGKAMWD